MKRWLFAWLKPADNAFNAPTRLEKALLFALCVGVAIFLLGISARQWGRVSLTPYDGVLTVCGVEADPNIPGRAYAQLVTPFICNFGPNGPDTSGTVDPSYLVAALYQTDDYGQSWHLLPGPVPADWQRVHSEPPVKGLGGDGNGITFNGHVVWSAPRAVFNKFFSNALLSPYGYLSLYGASVAPPTADSQPGVLYFALGSLGVLSGPSPYDSATSNRGWHLATNDFAGLPPLRMTITNPIYIIIIVLLALLVPPLPWINAWLLAQAWRYMFPITETRQAMRLARRASIIISAMTALAITVWLIDFDTDFYQIVGIMAVVSALISVVIGVRTSRERHFTDRFTRRLALATVLVSLIVPLGVASTLLFVGWPIILGLLLGFVLFRRALIRYLDRFQAHATLWQTDRLTLELEFVLILLLFPVGLVVALLGGSSLSFLLPILSIPFLSALTLAVYTSVRGQQFALKKKEAPLALHETPLFADTVWLQTLFWRAAGWLGTATLVSVLVFALQAVIYLVLFYSFL